MSDHDAGGTRDPEAPLARPPKPLPTTMWAGGPRDRYEQYGRLQFIALIRRGLRPDSVVIDVGCGALRAGYWLIHFLDPGHYHGIEPWSKHLEIARAEVLEPGLEEVKRPRFDHNREFDLSVFGVAPDFVLARSIWSHTSRRQMAAMLDSFAAVAASAGLMLVSYLPVKHPRPSRIPGPLREIVRRARGRRARRPRHERLRHAYMGDEWAHEVIAHDLPWIEEACRVRGLVVVEARQDDFGEQKWLEIRRASAVAPPDGLAMDAGPKRRR